ncbi:MAG: hypothetical protein WAK86_12195 [Pseudonocardiaceae bacterium]
MGEQLDAFDGVGFDGVVQRGVAAVSSEFEKLFGELAGHICCVGGLWVKNAGGQIAVGVLADAVHRRQNHAKLPVDPVKLGVVELGADHGQRLAR